MLIGEYIHTVDEKSRMSLPAKFRKELGKKVVIAPGLDSCLFVFPVKEWERVSRSLSHGEGELSFLRAEKRSFNRFMFGRASEVDVDSIGRILIPAFLKDRIGLKSSAAVVGVDDRVEIWNEKTWYQYREKMEKEADQLAEKLGNEKKDGGK